MKVHSSALKKWISAFSEAGAMNTGIANVHFVVFSSLLLEFGSIRLHMRNTVMIKPVLSCLWGQHFDAVHIL